MRHVPDLPPSSQVRLDAARLVQLIDDGRSLAISHAWGKPIGDALRGMSEVEFRLHTLLLNGEGSDGDRLDFWLGTLTACYLNVHRKAGAALVKVADIRPAWRLEERVAKESRNDEATASAMLLAWAKSGSRSGG